MFAAGFVVLVVVGLVVVYVLANTRTETVTNYPSAAAFNAASPDLSVGVRAAQQPIYPYTPPRVYPPTLSVPPGYPSVPIYPPSRVVVPPYPARSDPRGHVYVQQQPRHW